MTVEKIYLKENYHVKGGELTCFIADMPFDENRADWKRPAVIVVGGGGYAMVSKRESEPVALRFLAKGFQAFCLKYDCMPQGVKYPEQLLQLACAVDYVKQNATRFHVDERQVFAVGFSAGGHLVGNLSTDYMQALDAYGEALDCKLAAAGLCYPVISAKYGHTGSFSNLLRGAEDKKEALFQKVNLDEIVCARTVPAFIWATAEDSVVPVENSLQYARKLAREKISFELHIYPKGEHGLSTCDKELNGEKVFLSKNEKWLDDCASFFKDIVGKKFCGQNALNEVL